MRRNLTVVLALLCQSIFLASLRAVADEVPTVTIMQAGSDELERDLEFLMKLAGREGEQQWPVLQELLKVFLDGVDGSRPMRVDLILGKDPDTRLSIPVSSEKLFLANVGGFVGAKARRMAGGLYLFRPKPPALQYYTRLIGPARRADWGLVAEDKGNLPSNFQILAGIQPLIDAGFDLAATIENSKDGVEDRRRVILDLEAEVTATLQPFEDETDNEFAMRKLGLTHQFRELERIYADSQQLTLGWTTDQDKKEGRLDLELSALEGSDLANSIAQLAATPSRFAANGKSDESIFFGRLNHALDQMRQKHLGEMLDLMEKDALEKLAASSDYSETQKAGVRKAIGAGFEMLRAGTAMGVIDGFIDVSLNDGKKGVVGAIRVADASLALSVLEGLQEAGWEIEIGAAGPEAGPAKAPGTEKTSDSEEKADSESRPDGDSGTASQATPDAADSAQKSADGSADGDQVPVAYHTVVLPDQLAATIQSLFGSAKFVLATTPQAVYYAAGDSAEERIRAAVAADSDSAGENDSTFLEAWYRVGPIIDVLRERRERREAKRDLSTLTPEEKASRKERQEMRERAKLAFADGADTIHTKIQRQENRVVGRTVFATGILRFVGMEIANVVKTKLQ